MKVGIITTPNQKGQIVIPKKIRDELGINHTTNLHIVIQDNGVFIYPVSIQPKQKKFNKQAMLKILSETKGAWAGDDWEETEKKRRKIEIAAARKRKNAW